MENLHYWQIMKLYLINTPVNTKPDFFSWLNKRSIHTQFATVTSCGCWPKEQDRGYKWPKWDSLRRVAGLSQRERVRSLVIHGSSESSCCSFASKGASPLGGVPVTSNWEETPGQTQNSLGLCISSGLGTPRDPPGEAEKHFLGKGGLEYPAASTTHPWISKRRWMAVAVCTFKVGLPAPTKHRRRRRKNTTTITTVLLLCSGRRAAAPV